MVPNGGYLIGEQRPSITGNIFYIVLLGCSIDCAR